MSKRSGHQAKKRRDRGKSKKKHVLRINSGTEAQGSKRNSTQTDEVSIGELKAIIERTATGPLDEQDRQLLLSVSETLQLLTEQLAKKSISIARLRKLLFGASTETLKNLLETILTDLQRKAEIEQRKRLTLRN